MIKIQGRFLMASAVVAAALLVMGSIGAFGVQEAEAAKTKSKTASVAVAQANECGNNSGNQAGTSATACSNNVEITIIQ